jgi:sodium-dependent phosphate cotransporter
MNELTDFLDITSKAITNLIPFSESMASVNFLSFIIDPVCERFILLDKSAIERLLNGSDEKNIALRCCNNSSYFNSSILNSYDDITCLKKCNYWCVPLVVQLGDAGTGLFLIIISLIIIIICLFGIVKVLSLIIVGPIEHGVNRALNANLPGILSWFTETLLFIISLLITIIIQSSNIVSATVVPLHAGNLVTLKRVYVIILGSNIGTTITGILTAFTQPASAIINSLQLAFVYTIFNTIGAILWLPIPQLRLPIDLSILLGKIVIKYRWFVKFYMTTVYFIIPIFIFLLSLIPYWIGIAVVGIPIIIFLLFLLFIKLFQKKAPKLLPFYLRKNYNWLPKWFRSLEPLDNIFKRTSKFCRCKKVHEFYINGDNQVVLRRIVMKKENGEINDSHKLQVTRF